jgi:small conductance mechanosensitive channel
VDRGVALLLLLTALVLGPGLLPGGLAQEPHPSIPGPDEDPSATGWVYHQRERLGPTPDSPVYVIDLWTSTELPSHPEQPPTLLFAISHYADDTPVIPAPTLTISLAHCHTGTPDEQTCDAARVTATETRHVVRENSTGETDGRYLLEPPPQRALHLEGTWRIAVILETSEDDFFATFYTGVDAPILPLPWIADLLLRLMGVGLGPFGQFIVFVFWVAFFLLTASILASVLKRTVLHPRRVDPTIRRLSVRLATGLWILFGVAFAMWIGWRVNFWAALAAVGLISVALGFGMQNTVANIMGGINLALDKPFVVGDRISIGDTWGEVEEVGIRSTRIATTKKETVIIPNKLMDEREIWNYTSNQPELRRDIEILISYDADRRLAEALMLEAARDHSAILPYPRPRVFLRDFADNGLKLQLRAWIADARDLRPIGSELRKAIYDKFLHHGIEIPYPYRTLVEKKDLPKVELASEQEIDTHLGTDERLPRMLYATAGPEPLDKTADLVSRIAHDLDMQLIVLHIQPKFTVARRAEAYRILSAFQYAATRNKIPFKSITREGDVTDEIKRTLLEEDIDLLVMGSSRQPFRWNNRAIADFTKEVRRKENVPVLILPRNLSISPRTLKHYRRLMEERHIGKRRETNLTGEDAAEDPEESDRSKKDTPEDKKKE